MVALPGEAYAQVAEAWWCRLALELLQAVHADPRTARMVGDNLAVIRYGAGTQRLRRTALQQVVDAALPTTLAAGWILDWLAVRRRFNQAADAVATEAVQWAHRLRRQGERAPSQRVEWFT